MEWIATVALGILCLVLLALLWIGARGTFRGTPTRRAEAAPGVSDPRFQSTTELLVPTRLWPGHGIRLLRNGEETFPPLWEDLRAARRSITLLIYYAKPGRTADELREILLDRARAGVRVLVLFDAVGSEDLPGEYFEALRGAGVEARRLRPFRPRALGRINHRAHVRAVVVDGEVGYTGGFGIADMWRGDGRYPDQWRDTNVRFTGPAVGQLQATFASMWAEVTGTLIGEDLFFPRPPAEASGTGVAGLLHTPPETGSTAAARLLALSVAGARDTLWISSGYFVPDDEGIALLVEAAGRGVEVRILTAGPRTDVPLTRWAGRARYERLLTVGVRIWEYQPAMMHAKTFVVDGIWCTVGAMNFDNRSLALNDESNLLVLDPEFGHTLRTVFREDLGHATEILMAEFRERPWTDRAREWGASWLRRLL